MWNLFTNCEVWCRQREHLCSLSLASFFTCSVSPVIPLYTPLHINWELQEVKSFMWIYLSLWNKRQQYNKNKAGQQGAVMNECVNGRTPCQGRVAWAWGNMVLTGGPVVRAGREARRTSVWVWTGHWSSFWTPLTVHILMWKMRKATLLLLLNRFSRVWLCATPETAAH